MTNQPYQGETPPPLPGSPNQQQGGQATWGRQGSYQYQQPPPPPAPPSMRSVFFPTCLAAGCATLVAPLVIIMGFFFFIIYLTNSSITDASSALGSYSSGSNLFTEKLIRSGDPDQGTIAIISLLGEITGAGSSIEGSGTLANLSEQLNAAVEDDEVKAVIIQIDSPGGGLTPSDMLYNEILKLRDQGKTVVVWTGSLMASGGYYIAVASENIMASPTATIGSIGVIMNHYQVDGLMKMLGLKANPIMAGASKDLGSPFREMTPQERAVLQENVDHAHNRFIQIVAKGRDMSESEARIYADGSIFTAEAALKNNLIDKIGYIDEAIEWTEELTGKKNMRIVSYRRIFSFAEVLSGAAQGTSTLFNRLLARTERHSSLQAEWAAE